MDPFRPLFRNPHLQTILGHYWRVGPARRPVDRRRFRTDPEVEVEVLSEHPLGEAAGEIVMVHGLEGSADAGYMRRLSGLAVAAGFATHRLNLRTCGGTEHLCATLYHAGLTTDLLAVLKALRAEGRDPAFLAGFSLGGNMVLKLAGELGETASDLIGGVVSVSTPLDLDACSRRIADPSNRVYEKRFVRRMIARLRATGRYAPPEFAGLGSVRAIDDRITAPSFGFGTAANYYRTQSAIRFLHAIRVPVLLIQAKDDIFVPFEIFEHEAVRSNPRIELLATEYGGHLGFLGRSPERFWADAAIMEWISTQNAHTQPAGSSRI
jgi:predicted alpha/beta-fold hydrolase